MKPVATLSLLAASLSWKQKRGKEESEPGDEPKRQREFRRDVRSLWERSSALFLPPLGLFDPAAPRSELFAVERSLSGCALRRDFSFTNDSLFGQHRAQPFVRDGCRADSSRFCRGGQVAGNRGRDGYQVASALELKRNRCVFGLIPIVGQIVRVPELAGLIERVIMLGDEIILIFSHIGVSPCGAFHMR